MTTTTTSSTASPHAVPQGSGGHRHLQWFGLAEVRPELDRLEAAHREGRLRMNGAWTPGQICTHVARFMHLSREGFGFALPAPVRGIARLFKPWMLGSGKMPKGIRIPPQMSSIRPEPECSFEDGLAALRAELDAVENGARFEHPSPLFGTLAHEEWERIHAKHAAHHLGFLEIVDA